MNRKVMFQSLVAVVSVLFAFHSPCIAEKVDLGTYGIAKVFEISIEYDTEKQEIKKSGSVLGLELNEHTTGGEKVYGNVYHFHDKEEFKVAGKKVAGLKWNCAVDLSVPKITGYCVRVGYPKKDLFKTGLDYETEDEKNWPDAIEVEPTDKPQEKIGGRLKTLRALEGDRSSVLGGITAHAGYLYWYDKRGNQIRRARINLEDGTLGTSAPVTTKDDDAFADPNLGFAVSNDELFYFDTRPTHRHLRGIRIDSSGLASGGTYEVEHTGDQPSSIDATKGIAIASSGGSRQLYYWDNRNGRAYKCVRSAAINDKSELLGSKQVEVLQDGKDSSIQGCLAEADGYLYWFDNRRPYRSIRRAKLTEDGLGRSQEVETPPSSVDPAKGLGISLPYFYWFDTDDQQLVVGRIVESKRKE